LTARMGGQVRGIIAGGLFLLLPAGLHHGLLVNYETIALPAVLLLTRNILLKKKSGLATGIFAGLADYVALTPLVFTARSSSTNPFWRKACLGGLGVTLFLIAISRFQAPGSWSETLGQATGASFLATDFSLQNWLGFGGSSLWALFGWALPLASLGIVILCRHQGKTRKVLRVLLLTALFNVTVFAHHATTHEHYWLFFALPVALSIALLPLPPLHKKYAVSNALLALLVIGLGFIQAKNEWDTWGATKQADRADAFSQVADPDLIYLHPDGLPLVFLHRAQRHAVAREVRSLNQAKELVQSYREQVGLDGMQAAIFLERGRPVPPWLAAVTTPDEDSGLFTFWVLEKTP
ncbi:MAG: hypothetical protein VX916_06260, partial [Planctomycetota bacterium]|nr:hypothetical protein [Planctomycetota bacterium]